MTYHLGHYLTADPSAMHRDIEKELATFHTVRGRRRNRLAPRGGGKTVWHTTGYVSWAALEGVEPYTLILSETAEQANAFLRDIRAELENNERIGTSYPHSAGRGPIWRDNLIQLRNGCMIQARGVGGSIRGLKNRESRPTLIVVDDPNEDDDAYSPTLRRRKLNWFRRAVLNVGGPTTNVMVIGTPIHREAIVWELYRGDGAGNWQTTAYKSIVRWPDRADLWGEWERVASNLADPDRDKTARAFYEANRTEMDLGAEVLWPAREPLYDLMRHRLEIGHAAFMSEKQDEPGIDGATEWPGEWFDRADLWFDRWPQLSHRVQTLDPSKGSSSKAGDYQAHVMLGLGRDGVLYFDAELRRDDPVGMVGRCLDIAAEFQPNVLVAESNATMGLLTPEIKRQLAERAAAGRPQLVRYEEMHSTDPKLARIRQVGSYLGQGRVRVRNTPGGRMLVQQWRVVPCGDYDDGPDAAGVAVRRLTLLVNGV